MAEPEVTSSRSVRRARLRRVVALAPRVLPFTSLAFSVVSATLMNRHPHAAPRIVAVAPSTSFNALPRTGTTGSLS